MIRISWLENPHSWPFFSSILDHRFVSIYRKERHITQSVSEPATAFLRSALPFLDCSGWISGWIDWFWIDSESCQTSYPSFVTLRVTMCAAIWSHCAVLFESEPPHFPRTSRQLRSAAQQLCTGFYSEHPVLILSYFYSESN